MDQFLNNSLRIEIQPKQNFHFRYTSELKNTHGCITGQAPITLTNNNCSSAETYPTIHLKLPADANYTDNGTKREFFVLCSLHAYDENKFKNNQPLCLSPHLLLRKCERDVNYEFIFEEMKDLPDDVSTRFWELQDYVIVRLKTDQYQQSWQKKQRQYNMLGLPLPFNQLKGDLDVKNSECVKKSGSLNVCLGFTIFECVGVKNYRLYKETIYSDNIYHSDDLKIHRLCNFSGSKEGGDYITLLIKLQAGYNYEVRIFRGTEWEVYVKPHSIFCNSSITFQLPPYTGPNTDLDSIDVLMEVVVDRSRFKSTSVKFEYVNNKTAEANETVCRKRPRLQVEVNTESVASTSATEQIFYQNMPIVEDLTGAAVPSTFINIQQQQNDQYQILGNSEFYSVPPNDLPDDLLNCNISQGAEVSQSQEHQLPHSTSNLSSGVQSMNITDTNDLNPVPDQDLSSLLSLILEENYSANFDSGYISRDKMHREVSMLRTMPNIDKIPRLNSHMNVKLQKSDNDDSNISRDEMRKYSKKLLLSEQEIIKKLMERCLTDPKTAIRIPLSYLSMKFGNTIFHDAIMIESTLLALRQIMKTTPHKQMVLKARNKFRHNLLHYACFHNMSGSIRPLVGMGIALHEQDINGRTPLHLAIDYKHSDCVEKIQELLKNHSLYGRDVETSLKKMLQVYTLQGITVLHLAVLENLPELLEVMLDFCQRHDIDVTQYEVMGSGDSLAHLVVKSNSCTMFELLKKYIPNYLKLENYAGNTIADICDISDQMKNVLKI
ncbi:nuclear factor NF-kappa-B p110 subunit-like [Musca autumnalis]|uniref:nuclear factor NF-kappa-B p110 subunit-like n=1 Tax=Musca autumnalis TaxID=221902 RepID=UPI003CF55119